MIRNFWRRICTALAVALILLGSLSTASAQDTASRIQAKIAKVGAGASKLHDQGGDVSPIQKSMQQVSELLQNGNVPDAEKILDSLLAQLGMTPGSLPVVTANCDPQHPMMVAADLTIAENCTVGGDLIVTGNAVLHFDYTARSPGQVTVAGNVIVRDHATLWVQGARQHRAIFAVDNDYNSHRSITTADDAAIKLEQVEFRTQRTRNRDKGSLYMSYDARGRSYFEAKEATLVAEESWLLTTLHDHAALSVIDSQNIPTEIYVQDQSSAKISGTDTKTGLWLDAGGVKGTLKIPDVGSPFSWRVGAGSGLDVHWTLQVEDAQPGIGIEIRPGSELTIIGNGARAPISGEVKISYFVVDSQETLDGLKAGLQNRKISDRLTLDNVQLGPIAWQIYAGDHADVTARNSTINEIGIFGRDAKVRVDHSVLQLAVLGAMAPGSSLDIRDTEIWNQTVEVAGIAKVSVADSTIHGSLFLARDKDSTISISRGSFEANPAGCTLANMVNLTTGQPRCNPFRTPGMPQSSGAGKVECSGTQGCTWTRRSEQ